VRNRKLVSKVQPLQQPQPRRRQQKRRQPAITSATVKTTTAATTATGEPKYGGEYDRLTDQASQTHPAGHRHQSKRFIDKRLGYPYLEWYGFGDIETTDREGPTNTHSATTYVPDQYWAVNWRKVGNLTPTRYL